MQVIRDLIRDLVGILFPGGLLVALTLWSVWAVTIIFTSSILVNILPTDNNFLVLLIFSYIAGQSLRIKRLGDLEKLCTEYYRKKVLPHRSQTEWEEETKNIDNEERNYWSGDSSIEELREVYKQYNERFQIWETFPYGYLLKGRRLLRQSEDYNCFFEKYDKQGLMRLETFFNFCKSVIYEYSPSFKEEVLRQESLVRLFAGLYYVIKYGRILSVVVGILHIVLIVSHNMKVEPFRQANTSYSYGIVAVCLFAFIIFIYLNKEILQRLRFMRVKELNLAHDAFYLICKKNNVVF